MVKLHAVPASSPTGERRQKDKPLLSKAELLGEVEAMNDIT